MADLAWQGDGPDFTVEVDGRTWRLDLGSPHPGLTWRDAHSRARLLVLDHVATAGRRDETAFDPSSLTSLERHRGRIQAIYAPRGLPGLNVRAAWSVTVDRDGFDLEVQTWSIQAGVFRRLEVTIETSWTERPAGPLPAGEYRVVPRDARSAALTYDGREPNEILRVLHTSPPADHAPGGLGPVSFPVPGRPPAATLGYLELVSPNDCSRRIVGTLDPPHEPGLRVFSYRHGLFGHDLEKGVVLRGRLRSVVLDRLMSPAERIRRYDDFLAEPPALGP